MGKWLYIEEKVDVKLHQEVDVKLQEVDVRLHKKWLYIEEKVDVKLNQEVDVKLQQMYTQYSRFDRRSGWRWKIFFTLQAHYTPENGLMI